MNPLIRSSFCPRRTVVMLAAKVLARIWGLQLQPPPGLWTDLVADYHRAAIGSRISSLVPRPALIDLWSQCYSFVDFRNTCNIICYTTILQ
jgi:hypothetical protein